jgi:tRNA G18 (ribose-2'-O)-methylase SpoU
MQLPTRRRGWRRVHGIEIGMKIERIDRAADPRLDGYRDLRDADLLRGRGVFAAEGRLIVRRVIEERRFAVASVLVNEAALRDLEPTFEALDPVVPIFVCPTGVFPAVTGFNLHRGCVALVRRPPALPLPTLIAGATTLLVLDGVSNPDNVGGIARNAAAFGADGLLLSPTSCDPLYRKAIRTSMGAVLNVPFVRCDDGVWPGVLSWLRDAGFSLVALTPREPSNPLDSFAASDRPTRIALLLGAEGAGLAPAVEALADHRVRIPIGDRVDSLNVAVAAGVALYRLRT